MSKTKIKLCGLFRLEDAEAANLLAPDYAGFVFYEKSRRYVDTGLATQMRAILSPTIRTVGVFVNAPLAEITQPYEYGIISIAQLHGQEEPAYIAALRALAPGLTIWQAFQIKTAGDAQAAADSPADLVLLDSGAGTGQTFDWSLLSGFPRPYLLAGGLTPENIPDAIAQLHPYGVDISSGIETGGLKDPVKMMAAVQAARRVTP